MTRHATQVWGTAAAVLMLLTAPPGVPAAPVVFDGATTHQTVDGIGVNVNYRGWEGTNLVPVLDALIEQAGISLFRVTFDLSDWERRNDNGDSRSFNWDYYDAVYQSAEFEKLWALLGHLESRGFANNVCLTFMGWGPAWMMAPDGRTLKPGMEDEWAEMIASALIHARNKRGLQFQLVTPNNEPDIYDEGIRVPTAAQYTNALESLASKLDAAGITNLWFAGPCRSGGGTAFMPEMAASPVIMRRLRHFSIHSYSADEVPARVHEWIGSQEGAGRSLWVTEFNVWCDTCDDGVMPAFPWSYTRGTAEYLLHHLQNNVSGAFVWEGYDSIYAHHHDQWGFFGIIGVDDPKAKHRSYTPRKNFHTVSQISKWVRPGAQRIGVGQQSDFRHLLAFRHGALGRVTICGVNAGAESRRLDGRLVALPDVRELTLRYTTAGTNLAHGGAVGVRGDEFSVRIPADCVFTLSGEVAGAASR